MSKIVFTYIFLELIVDLSISVFTDRAFSHTYGHVFHVCYDNALKTEVVRMSATREEGRV